MENQNATQTTKKSPLCFEQRLPLFKHITFYYNQTWYRIVPWKQSENYGAWQYVQDSEDRHGHHDCTHGLTDTDILNDIKFHIENNNYVSLTMNCGYTFDFDADGFYHINLVNKWKWENIQQLIDMNVAHGGAPLTKLNIYEYKDYEIQMDEYLHTQVLLTEYITKQDNDTYYLKSRLVKWLSNPASLYALSDLVDVIWKYFRTDLDLLLDLVKKLYNCYWWLFQSKDITQAE